MDFFKIYQIDLENPQQQVQVTRGAWDDITPALSPDNSCLLYSSIKMVHLTFIFIILKQKIQLRLPMQSEGISIRNVLTMAKNILCHGFFNSQMRIYQLNFPEADTSKGESQEQPAQSAAQQSESAADDSQGSDLIKGEKVKYKLHPDILHGGVAYVSSGVFITQLTFAFSDLFNDHELFFTSYTFDREMSYLFQYAYVKKRTDYFFDFYDFSTYDIGFDETIAKTDFGTSVGVRYPFNRNHRIDCSFNLYRSEYTQDEKFVRQNPDFFQDRRVIGLDVSLISDKAEYAYFGPVSGYRTNFTVQEAIGITDSYASFVNFLLDARKYIQLSDSSLLATRFSMASSQGADREIFLYRRRRHFYY